MMILMLITAFSFGYVAYQRNQKLEEVQTQVDLSLQVRDLIQDLNTLKIDPKKTAVLKNAKPKYTESDRHEALSNLIQAYNSENENLFERRTSEFLKLEKKFFKISQWRINKYKNEVRFYLSVATFIPLAGLFALLYFINIGILNPLHSLSKRMMQFLIDQYTFQFTHPKNNEIGDLERTFNSLAQKVLNNMDELLALDRAKSEFVSIASHELRTPLTSIKGSLGLLSNGIAGELDNDAKEMVNVAEQETDRLVRLINDMLDLAKIESRSLTLKKDWNSLDDLLSKTVNGLKGFAAAANVNLTIENELTGYKLQIDQDRIQQVITNLISNAIKYSPENGTVFLQASFDDENKVEIRIIDQGRGISEDNQRLIFEKFRQATDSSNHLVKGTGLGLAISKALVEEHEGEIGVRSVEGEGSTFFFTIPHWQDGNENDLEKAA